MELYNLFELSIYLILLLVIYKVVTAIDISKIFLKGHVTEIKIFYLVIIIVLTKVTGDFIVMVMEYLRKLLGIG